jgi:glyoxalase family protein
MRSAGIHHITAIAGDPQTNIDFYTETLGLRLVKRTVNFDDPGSYHFYFGDNVGNPGTIITFFPWPGARQGTHGSGQVTVVSFAVPVNSMTFWQERLQANHVAAEEINDRFGSKGLRFRDPDGLMLELIESKPPVIASENASPTWTEGSRGESFKVTSSGSLDYARDNGVGQHRISGFAAPTLEVRHLERTEKLLTEILGFEFVSEENNRRHLRGSGLNAAAVDLVSSSAGFGLVAVGSVHHIAFRVANDEEQLRVREQLVERGLHVTPVIDRQYFQSIYFREPNGILFEIATDGPGFLIDESADELGDSLKLPPMYESARDEIERVLPPIQLRHATAS